MTNPYIKTIATEGQAEYRDRGSLFLGFTFPFSHTHQLKDILQRLKKEHPKANHHCFAYRVGTDALQFRANDDGEPSGSAGKPILGQIDSRGLTDVLVVVVRYFGGTLLGVPGLIQAYKTTASLALQVTAEVVKPILQSFTIECGYDELNDVMVIMRRHDGEKLSLEQSLFCRLQVAVPFPRKEAFFHAIHQLPGVIIHKNTP